MKPYNNSNSMGGVLKPLPVRVGLVTLLLGVGAILSTPAHAVAPPANSVIGNQAIASYNDASGAPQTTLSNLVQTTVLPVGSFSLNPDNTKNIIAGQVAYLPHTLINNGNQADSFSILTNGLAVAINGAPTSIILYPDTNADGVPDDLNAELCHVTNIATGVLNQACSLGTVAAGGTYNFVVAVQSASSQAAAAPWEKYDLTATAGATNGITYTSTTAVVHDRVDIVTGAVFDVTKSISVPGGPKSVVGCGPTFANTNCYKATYTLTYTNKGNATGTIRIQDIIGAANAPTGTSTVGMAYIPSTAVWSGGGVLSDAAIVVGTADATAASGAQVYYQTNTAGAVTTIDAYVTGVAQNVSGTISFNVGILDTALKGTSTTTNVGMFEVPVTPPNPVVPVTPPNNYTPPVPYNVGLGQVFDVKATNTAGTIATDVADNVSAAGSVNEVLQGSAVAGQTISFTNRIWNAGDGVDTFDIEMCTTGTTNPNCILANNFPAGTAFALYKADTVNPLLDTTGNGIPDTGELAAYASYDVIVKATIPANACVSGCPAGSFTIQKLATSAGDSNKHNAVYDRLTSITAPSVDLKNGGSAANQVSAANAALDTFVPSSVVDTVATGAITTKSTGPGAASYFDLYVYNTTSTADSYELFYNVTTGAMGTFNSAPAGWSVQFRTDGTPDNTGTCSSTTGTAITSTNLINGTNGTNYYKQHICAVVTAPTTATKGDYDVYFKSSSRTTGVSDTKLDRVTIAVDNDGLVLVPNNQGQIYPGGTISYTHRLTNTGSSACSSVALGAKMDIGLLNQGWAALVYEDTDGSGNYSTGDVLVVAANGLGTTGTVNSGNLVAYNPATPLPAPGVENVNGTINLVVKVIAPNGAAIGATDLVTLTATGSCGTNTTAKSIATDLTTVINGQLRLFKEQAYRAACAGALGLWKTDLITAKPGDCVRYRITATNEGIAPVNAVVISDTIPAFTTYDATNVATCSTGALTAIAGGAAPGALVRCTGPATLNPGAQEELQFEVKINQ